jgi:surfactin synthase thioesterase subunit
MLLESGALMAPAHEWDAWIRRFHPAPAGMFSLACFPPAGGSASFYYPLSAGLSPAVEVLALQYPGRQDRRAERPIGDIRQLADRAADVLASWQLDRPLALLGHGMGATVAFEVARRLECETTPLVLFVSGQRAPSRHRQETVDLADDRALLAELTLLTGADPRRLGDDGPPQVTLPAIRSDLRAAAHYRCPPGPQLTCPIVALVGDADPRTSIEQARAWQEHTCGDFDLRVLDGGHFYINTRRAEVIDTVLTQTLLHC